MQRNFLSKANFTTDFMKRFLICAMLSLLLGASTCVKRQYALIINNNANHSITFYVGNIGTEHVYPDTALESNKPPMSSIAPGKSMPWGVSYPFEEFIQEFPADTISLYLFHLDTLNRYNWPVIRSNYKVLRRYDLSIEYLHTTNFRVNYP